MSALLAAAEQAWFPGVGGLGLFEARFRPLGRPRACVVLVHGLRDHGARYGELADRLARRGVAVHAVDLRGHGMSHGERVWVHSFDDYLGDLDLVVRRAQEAYPGRPIFLFGHGMGGTIVMLYVIAWKPDVQGLIVSGGSLRPGAGVAPGKARTALILSTVMPRLRTLKVPADLISSDPSVVAKLMRDPMVDERPGPARTAGELIRARAKVQSGKEGVWAPLLILHGSADKVSSPEGSRELFDKAGSADKTLKIYDGLSHDLLHEPQRARVLDDIVGWVASRAR